MLSLTLAFFLVVTIAALFGVGTGPGGMSAIAWLGSAFGVAAFLAALIWHVHLGQRSHPRH